MWTFISIRIKPELKEKIKLLKDKHITQQMIMEKGVEFYVMENLVEKGS